MSKHVKPPVGHHYVPQFLLRRFTDESGMVHYFDKRIAENGVLAGRPEKVFKQRHLNSYKASDGTKNPAPEIEFFGVLDDVGAQLVDTVVTSVRAGKTPQFSPSDREAWDFFVYHQWKRAPDTYERLGLHAEFPGDLPQRIAEFEREVRPLTDEERAQVLSEEGQARILHNASVSARTRPGPEVLEALAARGLVILRIKNPNKSFVVGTTAVTKLAHPGKTHLAEPSVEAWMPIASDVAVSPGGPPRGERIIHAPGDAVRYINQAIFEGSRGIAGRSPRLIGSLARIGKTKGP